MYALRLMFFIGVGLPPTVYSAENFLADSCQQRAFSSKVSLEKPKPQPFSRQEASIVQKIKSAFKTRALSSRSQDTEIIKIRPIITRQDMTEELLQSILKLYKQNIKNLSDSLLWSPENELRNLSHEGTCLYVQIAETMTDKLVGFISFFKHSQDLGHIHLLAVDQNFRRRGIGTTLLKSALLYFKQQRSQAVDITSWNPDAIKLYERIGFNKKSQGQWYTELTYRNLQHATL